LKHRCLIALLVVACSGAGHRPPGAGGTAGEPDDQDAGLSADARPRSSPDLGSPGPGADPGLDGAAVQPDGVAEPPAADAGPPPPLGACGTLTGPAIVLPLFTPPPAGFTLAANEAAVDVALESRPLAEVQAAIDAARAKDTTTLIRVALKGSFEVTAAPLRLPSRTTLLLDGTLLAAATASAPSLIAIAGAELVGVSGGTLDASNKVAVGIAISDSAHVHIDDVRISGATGDGLHFAGKGSASTDAGSSLTRVEASGAHGNGLVVADATNVIVMDCYSHDNQGAGLVLGGAFGMAVNNRLRKNGTGLVSPGTSNLLYRNALDCNTTGLVSADASDDVMIVQNQFGGNGKDLTLAGKANVLFGNLVPAGIEDGGQGNFVLGNAGPFKTAGARSGNLVFQPPSLANRHRDPVTPGQARADLMLTPQTAPDLGAALAKARTDHPGATLVVNLVGDFSLAGTLTLTSDTVLLIEGTLGLTGTGSALSGAGLRGVAISGGTIDCGGQAVSGLSFDNGVGVMLDGVKVVNCRADAVHFSHGRPNIIHRTTVVGSNRRCLWAQSLSRLLVIDSAFSGCTMDGIDMDSHDSLTYSLGNHAFDNKRYGVFFEEGGKHNVAVANLTERNGKGVNVYSNASPGTNFNLVVANRATGNSTQGLRAGALPMMDTSSNYFFNNVVSKNGSGLYQDGVARLNYFSQNVLVDNAMQIVDSTGALVLFNPPVR
jgi:hypothetical protein